MALSDEVIIVISCSVNIIRRFGQIPKPDSVMIRIDAGIISPTSGIAIRLVNRKFVGRLPK